MLAGVKRKGTARFFSASQDAAKLAARGSARHISAMQDGKEADLGFQIRPAGGCFRECFRWPGTTSNGSARMYLFHGRS